MPEARLAHIDDRSRPSPRLRAVIVTLALSALAACGDSQTPGACGDGEVDPGEACDDGNTAANDGCSAACAVEACGDHVTQTVEACDGDDLRGETCVAHGFASGTLACGAGCTFDERGCVAHRCGDGILGPGEQCDDHNTDDDDGCSHACETERCGDGVVQTGESCDDGGTTVDDGCSATCAVEIGWACPGTPSVCTVPTCGNGTLDRALGEECDDSNTTAGDGCAATCRFEITCAAGQVALRLSAAGLPVAIPDNSSAGVTSAVAVTTVGSASKVMIGIGQITHTFDRDLALSVTSPGGVRRTLASRGGADGDNVSATLFSDAAATALSGLVAPFRGAVRPEQTLATQPVNDFEHGASAGAWSLKVTDNGPGDVGTLDAWTLLMCVEPGVVCGDGTVAGSEECDDGNAVDGDGCSHCSVDFCGDSVINDGGVEECDDGNAVDGDGCEADCTLACGQTVAGARAAVLDAVTGHCYVGVVQNTLWANAELACEAGGGYLVVPESQAENTLARIARPAAATWLGVNDVVNEAGTTAANFRLVTGGILGTGFNGFDVNEPNNSGNEDCVQFNASVASRWNDLPCTNTLPSYICELEPEPCGDGVLQAALGETCDDGNTVDGDGCAATCTTEAGMFCSHVTPAAGFPSVCKPIGCGDGGVEAGETCDDSGVVGGDGCSATCQVETGFTCTGTAPSVCTTTCGDGVIAGTELCDDHGTASYDGCSATCQVENTFSCTGAPSTCTTSCGDGLTRGVEECDDGNATANDGCTACQFDIACAAGETVVRVRSGYLPTAIPDNNTSGISRTVAVTATGTITKVVAGIGELTHTYDDDLDIALESPQGTRRDLSSDNGYGGDGFFSVHFADGNATAVTTLDQVNAVIRGAYRPEQSLSTTSGTDFLGQSPTGTWTLKVVDDEAGDVGSLTTWTVLMCVQ